MATKRTLPAGLVVSRGETQKDVNYTILTGLLNKFSEDAPIEALDLPCGNLEFLICLQTLFPAAKLHGADIATPLNHNDDISFVEMDLSREFNIPNHQRFDLITSISGVMMFGNTLSFVRNCAARLKSSGTFILTNDNSATITDRLAYLFLGRFRMFNLVYEDTEAITQNVPVHELCRLLRTHGVAIERIEYTAFYLKDLLYLPFALAVYPLQLLYLLRLNTKLPAQLKWQMYPFKHFFANTTSSPGGRNNNRPRALHAG